MGRKERPCPRCKETIIKFERYCAKCRSEYYREWGAANPERKRELNKRYYEEKKKQSETKG